MTVFEEDFLRVLLIAAALSLLIYQVFGEPDPSPPPVVIHPLEPVIPKPSEEWICYHDPGWCRRGVWDR